MFTNSLPDGLGGRLGTRCLFLGRDRDPTHVPWVNGVARHGVAGYWFLGIHHEELVIIANHTHEFPKSLHIIVILSSRHPVFYLVNNHTRPGKVESYRVYVVGVENDTWYSRQCRDFADVLSSFSSLPFISFLYFSQESCPVIHYN